MESSRPRAIRPISSFRPFPFPLFGILRGIMAGPKRAPTMNLRTLSTVEVERLKVTR